MCLLPVDTDMAAIPESITEKEPMCGDVLSTSRVVYPTDHWTVVKIPKYTSTRANQDEVDHWEKYRDPSIMAPIVDYADDYSWIEMLRCYRIDDDRDDHLVDAFMEKMAPYDFEIGDVHPANIGIHPVTKKLVSIDYADLYE